MQVGQFVSSAVAADLGTLLRQQGLPFDKPTKAVDAGGRIWYLVATKVNFGSALPLLLLPAATPKS